MKVLVPASCPYCSSKKTARGGYIKEAGASSWVCKNPKCGKTFTVKTFIFQKEP